MKHLGRTLTRAITALAVVSAFSGAGTAVAGGNDNGNGNGNGHERRHLHLHGGMGPFVPFEPSSGGPVVEACGTTLRLSQDAGSVQIRITQKKLGTLVELVGTNTVSIVTDDGRQASVVQTGDYAEFDFNDGTIAYASRATNLNFATSPEERAEYAAHGLPPVFNVTKGKLVETIDADGTPNVVVTPKRFVDVCTLLTPIAG